MAPRGRRRARHRRRGEAVKISSLRETKVALRAAEVLSKLGAFGLKLLLDQGRGESSAKRRARTVELRTILTKLGPTFVKIGRGLSTRSDLCPSEYLEELSELQDLGVLHIANLPCLVFVSKYSRSAS